MTNIFVDTCYVLCIHIPTPTLISTSLFYFSEENVNCSVVSGTLWPRGLYLCPWDPPGKNTGVGCHSLLHGVFLTQGLIPGLPHCRQILYHLSHQGKAWGKLLTWKKEKEKRRTAIAFVLQNKLLFCSHWILWVMYACFSLALICRK